MNILVHYLNKQIYLSSLTLLNFKQGILMQRFYNNLLPSMFDGYFFLSKKVPNYNTRLSSRHAYGIPHVRTTYGVFI